MKDTLVIAYNGGSYGTYLHWAMTTLSTAIDIVPPFITAGPGIGTSHAYQSGKNLLDPEGWQRYLASDITHDIVKLHPKTRNKENLAESLENILNDCSKMILLYPSRDTELLGLNNYMQKTKDDWWEWQMQDMIDPTKIYENWPVNADTPINQIPVWIRREFLSYYLMPAWREQVEWYFPEKWSHERCLILTTEQLLFEFDDTMCQVKEFWGQSYVKPVKSMWPTHEAMLELQLNIGQDELCHKIVDSVMDKHPPFNWSAHYLPLGSQVWIQWELRQQGIEIQCHGLDIFPISTEELKAITYAV